MKKSITIKSWKVLLKNYAQTDEILFKHLNGPRAKNVMYTSPRSQMTLLI